MEENGSASYQQDHAKGIKELFLMNRNFTLTDKFTTNLSNFHEANINHTKLQKEKEITNREFN